MIDFRDATDEELSQYVDEMLAQLEKVNIERLPFGWRLEHESAKTLWMFLEARVMDDGATKEPVLEVVRLLRELGHSGSISEQVAMAALALGTTRRHSRVMIGVDPRGTRRQALLAGATLHLEDLQLRELNVAIEELAEW